MSFQRSHQTILFIYAEEANPHYKARVNRLLECVNDENIQVDTVTVMPDGKVFVGSPFQVDIKGDPINPSGHSPAEIAKEFEYNLVIQASPSTLVPEMLALTADEKSAPEGPPVPEVGETAWGDPPKPIPEPTEEGTEKPDAF